MSVYTVCMSSRVAVALILVATAATVSLGDPPEEPNVPYARPGTQQFPAPGPNLEARPWKVGQWAIYERRYGQAIWIEKLQILAEEACGFWIRDEIRDRGHSWGWDFCVSHEPTAGDTRLFESLWAVIERRDLEVVAVTDFHFSSSDRTKFEWLVELVRADWPGHDELPREDITTPNGQFAQAVKTSSTAGGVNITRWSHPEVPLGGLVRELGSNDHERLLLRHGTGIGDSSIVRGAFELVELQRQLKRRGTSWLSLAAGYDALGTVDDVSQTVDLEFAAGVRVAPRLDFVFTFDGIGEAPYPSDPTLSESMLLATGGIRWMPYGLPRPRQRFGLASRATTALFLQADLGYAELARYSMDVDYSTVGRGIAAGARLGLLVAQGGDWTFGAELHDHLALLNADEGLRHSFGARIFVQFYLF